LALWAKLKKCDLAVRGACVAASHLEQPGLIWNSRYSHNTHTVKRFVS
jgi:hypothetical protein